MKSLATAVLMKQLSKKKLKQLADRKQSRRFKFVYVPAFLCFTIIFIFHFAIEDFLLRRFGVCHTAIVTRELDYHRGSSSTYKFVFDVDGRIYTGDSGIISGQDVYGDKISIVYLKTYPDINRSMTWFENEFDCVPGK